MAHLPPIAPAALQAHYGAIHVARNLHEKIQSLLQSLATGFVNPARTTGGPEDRTLMTPQQRAAVSLELAESQRTQSQLVAQCTAFVTLHGGQERISAEIIALQSRRQQRPPSATSGPPAGVVPGASQTQMGYPGGMRNGSGPGAAGSQIQQHAPGGAGASAPSGAAYQARAAEPQRYAQPPLQLQTQGLAQPLNGSLGGASGTGNSIDGMGTSPTLGHNPNRQVRFAQAPVAPGAMGSGVAAQTRASLQTKLRPEVFMKSLFDVMRQRGEPITGFPYIEGKEVDLFQLYQAVLNQGGSAATQASNGWSAIALSLGFTPSSSPTHTPMEAINLLGQQLASTYQKLLAPFEIVWERAVRKQLGLQDEMTVDQQASRTMAQVPMGSRVINSSNIGNPPQYPLLQPPVPSSQPTNVAGGSVGGGKPNASPSIEELGEARHIVENLRRLVEASRPKIKLVTIATKAEHAAIEQLSRDITPLVRKVYEVLPLYVAMSGHPESAKRILTLGAMFQDQIKSIATPVDTAAPSPGTIPAAVPLTACMNLVDLGKLRDQMARCWSFVKQTAAAGRGLQQSQPPPTQPPPPAAAPPTVFASAQVIDPFSQVAQRPTLKMEDLKPPPGKSRRSISAATTPGAPTPTPGFSPLPNSAASTPAGASPPLVVDDSVDGMGKKKLTRGVKALGLSQGRGLNKPGSAGNGSKRIASGAGTLGLGAGESPTPMMVLEDVLLSNNSAKRPRDPASGAETEYWHAGSTIGQGGDPSNRVEVESYLEKSLKYFKPDQLSLVSTLYATSSHPSTSREPQFVVPPALPSTDDVRISFLTSSSAPLSHPSTTITNNLTNTYPTAPYSSMQTQSPAMQWIIDDSALGFSSTTASPSTAAYYSAQYDQYGALIQDNGEGATPDLLMAGRSSRNSNYTSPPSEPDLSSPPPFCVASTTSFTATSLSSGGITGSGGGGGKAVDDKFENQAGWGTPSEGVQWNELPTGFAWEGELSEGGWGLSSS